MIFDKLCGIVERHFPDLEQVMRSAKLFHWAGKPEDLPKNFTDQDVTFIRENFFLPFRTIAVEDSVSCMILEDQTEGQRGISTPRRFIECMGMNDEVILDSREARQEPPEYTQKALDWLRQFREEHGLIYVVLFGQGRMADMTKEQYKVDGVVLGIFNVPENGKIQQLTPGTLYSSLQNMALRNFVTSVEEVISFNTPNRFVVEIQPTVRKRNARSPKIPRSHDRPQYTLLTKTEIQKVWGVRESDHSDRQHPSAHWRRRHYRTFRAEKFIHVKDKTIVIPACWVGPTQKQVGNKVYKVRIDL